jgi:hypothetical protein
VSDVQALVDEQARYYRARAVEYDDWWFRRDRYDHGSQFERSMVRGRRAARSGPGAGKDVCGDSAKDAQAHTVASSAAR